MEKGVKRLSLTRRLGIGGMEVTTGDGLVTATATAMGEDWGLVMIIQPNMKAVYLDLQQCM